MVAADRREPDAVILIGVLLAADPEQAHVEQPHRAGENRLTAEVGRVSDVGREVAAEPWQQRREPLHAVELLAVAALAPARVVEVLLAPRCVDAGRLEMTPLVRADPDVVPRGRNGEAADTIDDVPICDRIAVAIDVAEVRGRALQPAVPRTGAVRAPQTPTRRS